MILNKLPSVRNLQSITRVTLNTNMESYTKADVIIIINGLILPLYPVLCCFKRDFYSVSNGSRDNSVLLSGVG